MDNIKKGIESFQLSKNRMEIIKQNDITILNDCYNANYDSMKAGIATLARLEGKRKIAVLGDMLELGEFSKELHCKVGKEVLKNNIDILITVGSESQEVANTVMEEKSNTTVRMCNDNAEAITTLRNILQQGDAVLIKASNGMHFIEIVNALKDERDEL